MRNLAKLEITHELLKIWVKGLLPSGAVLVGAGTNSNGNLELCFTHPMFPLAMEGATPRLLDGTEHYDCPMA